MTGQSPSQEEKTSWARRAGDGGQIHYIKQLSPYGVVLVLTDTKTGWGADFSHMMMVMGVLFCLLLIGNLILSLSLANGVLSPLLKLTRFIRNQGGLLPLEAFPRTKPAGELLTTTTVRTKLFVLFLLTVLAPLLCMVVLFSMMQNQYAKQEWERTVEAVSKQMSWTVSKQAEVYEGAANALSVNDLLNAYLSSSTGNFSSAASSVQGNISTTIYPESKDIAYFVLYDTNGNAKYSTLFSNNLSLFYLDPQSYESEEVPEIAWLPATPDIFNHLAIQLIKRVYHINQDGQGEIVGYLQLVLKPDAFQSVVVQGDLSFQIEDEQGNPMYKSDGYEDHSKMSEAVNRTSNAAGKSLVLEEKIPGLDWKMTVQFPLDALHDLNGELLWVVASVALLCFLIGLILSHWLVRPIGLLQNAMDRVNENNFEFVSKGKTRDEVSLLAHHFNRMVEKINQLVEEDFRSKLREKELNALKTQAEMSMLQQQINPHFLYNTLESINMEAQRNNGNMVSKMIGSLASLFRYSISSGPEQGVSLETEIEYTRYYVTIQEIRFRERFTVEWRINSETLHCKVLKFILQPIVENAINHGLSEYASGGELVISSQIENGRLMIRISDNGIGMRKTELEVLEHKLREGSNDETPPSSSSIRHGVGLSNVYQRLKIYYGEEADLIIESKYMKGTTVTLFIPLKE
ncbi:sensor histidine kinase YesM [Paenibacillus baekrokdamisoli]|nr:sensor histidine kinase YesM [Paenibacillus baekrokdamisoli]